MPQLSLYLTDETLERVRADAKRSDSSVSKYVSALIMNERKASGWPEGYWEQVYGCLKDPSFVVPEDLDASLDGELPNFDEV